MYKSYKSKKIMKRNNNSSKRKIQFLAQIRRRKQVWNNLFEKYQYQRCNTSMRTECLEEWDIYVDDMNKHFMNSDDNSLNPGSKCDTRSYLGQRTSESIDSGFDFNSIVGSETVFSECSPPSHEKNCVICNWRPGEKDAVRMSGECSIQVLNNLNGNSSPEQVCSSKITRCLEECERNRSEKNSPDRCCIYSNPKPLKIGCKLAERLGNQTTVSHAKTICLKSKIPERFDNIGLDIFKNNHLSPIQSSSENEVTDVFDLLTKRDSSLQQSDPVEISEVNLLHGRIKCDLHYECVERSEIIQDNCCNDGVEYKLARSQENGRKGCMQTENSHNQVVCKVISKFDLVNVTTAEHENKQNNFTSVLQLHAVGDNFASDSHSSSCVKQIVNEKVSKKESCDIQQNHSCILKHSLESTSNLKGTSHDKNSFYPAPNKNCVIEEQNNASGTAYIRECFVDLSYPNISVIKMSGNEKMIKKLLVKERNNDEENTKLTESSKIDCNEIEHQDGQCTQNMKKGIERETIFDSMKKNERRKKTRNISEWDIEYSHFITHHWAEFLNNSKSVLIPLPKKNKKSKLQRLDWESIMNQ